MAERPNHLPPGYPMISNNFALNLAQQQQLVQHAQAQQQQQQQQQHQQHQQQAGIAGVTNPDHQQMWQQIQTHYRSQSGADPLGQQQQITPQVAEFLRSRGFAQQQQPQPQGQQPYPNMGSMAHNNPNLHTQSPSLQNAQRQPLPQQQTSFGASQLGSHQAAQSLARGPNPAMLHALTNPNVSRQLGLLGNARNQQPQNGPNPARMQQPMNNQQSLPGQLPFQQGMFSPSLADGIRSSPQLNQPTTPQAQSMAAHAYQLQHALNTFLIDTQTGARLPIVEIAQKAAKLKREIEMKEQQLSQLNSNHNAETASVIHSTSQEIAKRKALHQRVLMLLRPSFPNGPPMQQGNDSNGPDAGSSPLAPAQANLQGGQPSSVPGWQQSIANMHYANQSNQPVQSHQQLAPQPNASPFHSSPPPNQSPAIASGSTQASHQIMQAMMINRPTHSPQPPLHASQPAGPSGLQSQHIPQPSLPQQGLPPLSTSSIPLIADVDRFNESLQVWLRKQGRPTDNRLLSVDGRPLILHELHKEVMRLGGGSTVNQRDLWPMIAAKLGWTAFPGNGTEPPRSSPQVANQVRAAYQMFLAAFESYYLQVMLAQKSHKEAMQSGVSQQQGPPRPPPAQPGLSAGRLIQYAHVSAEDMRARGETEHVIQQVEMNRGALQRQYLQQQALRSMNAQGTQSAVSQMQQMMQANGAQPFANQQQPIGPSTPQGSMINQSVLAQHQLTQGMGVPNGPPQLGRPPPMGGSSNPNPQGGPQRPVGVTPSKPSPEQLSNAQQYLADVRREYKSRNFNNLPTKQIPEHEKSDFKQVFEGLCRAAEQLDHWMPLFHAIFNDRPQTNKLLSIVMTTRHQAQLLANTNPSYIFDLMMIRRLLMLLQQSWERFATVVRSFDPSSQAALRPGFSSALPPSGGPSGGPPGGHPQTIQSQQQSLPPLIPNFSQQQPPRPPTAQDVQQRPSPQRPPSQMSSIRTPTVQSALPKHKPQGSLSAANISDALPSPAPSVSTPTATAATPHAHASPQTPKSPKTKAAPRGKAGATAAAKRRISKVSQPAPVDLATSAEGSLKRTRDDESLGSVETLVEHTSPSPKRLKAEWDGEASEAVLKKQADGENAQSDETAASFLQQMTELIQLANATEGQSSLPPAISDTLEIIMRSMGSNYDAGLGASSSAGQPSSRKSPKAQPHDEFIEFFDFSSFPMDDELGSTDTPDLVQASSTNPSPASASDTDRDNHPVVTSLSMDATKIVEPKAEHRGDPLRLGVWAEIDGGESEYYGAADGWKWEGSMGSLDTPWAIST